MGGRGAATGTKYLLAMCEERGVARALDSPLRPSLPYDKNPGGGWFPLPAWTPSHKRLGWDDPFLSVVGARLFPDVLVPRGVDHNIRPVIILGGDDFNTNTDAVFLPRFMSTKNCEHSRKK